MKRMLIALMAIASLFCFILAGCGGSSSGTKASYEDVFLGTWNAVEMSGEMEYNKDQLEAFRALGVIDVYINFEKDGKAVMCSIAGKEASSVEGTWTADSETQATLTLNGNSTEITLEDGLLSIPSTDVTVRFEKVDYREPVSATGGESSDSTASEGALGGSPVGSESSSSESASAQEASSSAAESAQSQAASASAAESASAQEASSSAAESAQSQAASSPAAAAAAPFDVSIDSVEVGADYEGKPALIVTYTWQNNTEKTTSYASSLHAKCFQNGVQLETAFVFEGIDSDGYMAEVRPGYGTTFQMAYQLKDTENPVEIEVGELFNYNGELLASKTFEL